MTAQADISQELRAIGGFILRAKVEIEAGQVMDLSPLEGRINELCENIEKLHGDDGRSLQAPLLALIDDFNHIGKLIEEKLEELKTELSGTNQRTRAASAYIKGAGGTE